MSGAAVASTARGSGGEARPIIVLIDPKWNFELENFNVERFFEEAKVSSASVTVLQGRFDKFCSSTSCADKFDRASSHLTYEDFRRLNQHYSICKEQDEEHYFRALDRRAEGCVNFEDFLLGCSAANPSTPHILNSFTGYVRARYIFDFYNTSRTGTLDFEELVRLLADARRHLDEDEDGLRRHAIEMAQELGEVNAVTLRVSGISGPLCDLRASTRWTGWRVRREIARQLQVPIDSQELMYGSHAVTRDTVLETMLPTGSSPVKIVLARTNWECWPCQPEPIVSDQVLGLERLVHISFQKLYQALVEEQLRGTSRLFRFHRSILHTKKVASIGAASVGASSFSTAATGGA